MRPTKAKQPKTTYLIDALYADVEIALTKKENSTAFKNNIDQYLAKNISRLSLLGPLKSVSFTQTDINNVLHCVGLTDRKIQEVIRFVKKQKGFSSSYAICFTPLYIAVALATRFFIISLDEAERSHDQRGVKEAEDQIKNCMYYMAVPMYALLQKKYFSKCDPIESVMSHAISNMIEKNRIRQTGNMLETIYVTTCGSYDRYKEELKEGDDEAITQYISATRTRLNSIMHKIANAYYDAFNNGDYLTTEKEDMGTDTYHEADSNIQYIDRTANKVVQLLITNGADMKLVEIAAKNNDVSVTDLRNYILTICTEKQMRDLRVMVESMLLLFLSDERYTTRDIGTDKFLLFALNTYKKSNTRDEHIIKIKDILDNWLKELGVYGKSGTKSTINNHRRAIYMFIVMEIIKLSK